MVPEAPWAPASSAAVDAGLFGCVVESKSKYLIDLMRSSSAIPNLIFEICNFD